MAAHTAHPRAMDTQPHRHCRYSTPVPPPLARTPTCSPYRRLDLVDTPTDVTHDVPQTHPDAILAPSPPPTDPRHRPHDGPHTRTHAHLPIPGIPGHHSNRELPLSRVLPKIRPPSCVRRYR
ncbi:hypothetical protein K439DRAFT_1631754 [Ramaria rubella]|nr:hypothetical protein K439DRAFT_1631754 [Ramaria rubella]